jgi:hypothetical protein
MMKPLDQQSALEIRYERSIRVLLDLALDHSCDQAKIAADVLLSTNGSMRTRYSKWSVHIPALRQLDDQCVNSALGVIHGAISLGRRPEFMIQGGAELFERLRRRWINVEEW